jgi:hypothetical protein
MTFCQPVGATPQAATLVLQGNLSNVWPAATLRTRALRSKDQVWQNVVEQWRAQWNGATRAIAEVKGALAPVAQVLLCAVPPYNSY